MNGTVIVKKPKKIEAKDYIGKAIDVDDETWEILNEQFELNTCDKCGCWHSTYDLIWITSGDFEPLGNEHEQLLLSDHDYDALCRDCYHDITKQGEPTGVRRVASAV